jgi:hypothetical protein
MHVIAYIGVSRYEMVSGGWRALDWRHCWRHCRAATGGPRITE